MNLNSYYIDSNWLQIQISRNEPIINAVRKAVDLRGLNSVLHKYRVVIFPFNLIN